MARTDPLRALGEEVRTARRNAGISQEQCGELAGLHRNEIGALERGEKNVSFTNLLRVCTALKIAPSELLRSFTLRFIQRVPPKRMHRRDEK